MYWFWVDRLGLASETEGPPMRFRFTHATTQQASFFLSFFYKRRRRRRRKEKKKKSGRLTQLARSAGALCAPLVASAAAGHPCLANRCCIGTRTAHSFRRAATAATHPTIPPALRPDQQVWDVVLLRTDDGMHLQVRGYLLLAGGRCTAV